MRELSDADIKVMHTDTQHTLATAMACVDGKKFPTGLEHVRSAVKKALQEELSTEEVSRPRLVAPECGASGPRQSMYRRRYSFGIVLKGRKQLLDCFVETKDTWIRPIKRNRRSRSSAAS